MLYIMNRNKYSIIWKDLGQVLDWLLRLHTSQTTAVRTFVLWWHNTFHISSPKRRRRTVPFRPYTPLITLCLNQPWTTQGRTDVRWRPGQEKSLAPLCSNLGSFGSNLQRTEQSTCDIVGTFRRLLVIRRPGYCAPLLRPWDHRLTFPMVF